MIIFDDNEHRLSHARPCTYVTVAIFDNIRCVSKYKNHCYLSSRYTITTDKPTGFCPPQGGKIKIICEDSCRNFEVSLQKYSSEGGNEYLSILLNIQHSKQCWEPLDLLIKYC